MIPTQQTAKPRESIFADHLALQYRAIGPAAIQAAVLNTVRQRPPLKHASIVQETD
ncbi:hypothetical protein QFZ34_003836 [Phyllobacterium ifriqiyense]|uniref:Uncharacterized protein n=1 Tax=Phyllobacterium ifriqiyense TaxID=314238 RepID=A0ABU0SD21_9HYPH|nr:hypothetical protein [Phyllobacterium ifriqiyense]MDQ0998654.1 hypothetical protein [Phyllobacterium ifriqiyense]